LEYKDPKIIFISSESIYGEYLDRPYFESDEPPANPEIELSTDKETVEQSTNKVINYLKENKFL